MMPRSLKLLLAASLLSLTVASQSVAEPIIVMRPPVAGKTAGVIPNDAFAGEASNPSSPVPGGDAGGYDYYSKNFEDSRFMDLPVEHLTMYLRTDVSSTLKYYDLERFKSADKPMGLVLNVPSMSGLNPPLRDYICYFGSDSIFPAGTNPKLGLISHNNIGGMAISAKAKGTFAVTVECQPPSFQGGGPLWIGSLARLVVTVK